MKKKKKKPHDRLKPGKHLKRGKSIVAKNHRFMLKLRKDGNLVMQHFAGINFDDNPRWQTGTSGRDVYIASMQDDGNFVLYNIHGQAIWDTRTFGHPGAWLRMQDDGNLVVYDENDHPLWASNTVWDVKEWTVGEEYRCSLTDWQWCEGFGHSKEEADNDMRALEANACGMTNDEVCDRRNYRADHRDIPP